MIEPEELALSEAEVKTEPSIKPTQYWNSSVYGPLLNQQHLNKTLKRNVWKCEIKSMLSGFMEDINSYQHDLKFKVSGKILNSSTYVLKTKTHRIIDSSLAAQEDIQEAQQIPMLQEEEVADEDFIEYEDIDDDREDSYDDEAELYEAFSELEAHNLLSKEQKQAFTEEKVNRLLSLDTKDLYKTLQQKSCILEAPPKLLYKRVQLKDLSTALTEVLKNKEHLTTVRQIKQRPPIDKAKMPFLPEKLIANAEKKRAHFENRITHFYDNLKEFYSEDPVPFLKLIREPNVDALVEAVLCVLHLINHNKIEIWKSYREGEETIEESLENSGENIYLTPL